MRNAIVAIGLCLTSHGCDTSQDGSQDILTSGPAASESELVTSTELPFEQPPSGAQLPSERPPSELAQPPSAATTVAAKREEPATPLQSGMSGEPQNNTEPANPSDPTRPTDVAMQDETLWQASADLDGDGNVETIRLISSEVRTTGNERADEATAIPVRGCRNGARNCVAVLHVGQAKREIKLTPRYFGGIDFSTIDIDTKDGRKELLFRRRDSGFTDPPFIFTVAIYNGKELRWQELEVGGGYDAGTLDVLGNGVVKSTYDACHEITTTTYQLIDNRLQKVKSLVRRARDIQECAACPLVYVETNAGFVPQGEILRNLSSAELEAQQRLPLDLSGWTTRDQPLHVQIREEKQETTFLDDVWIEADGVTRAPIGCQSQAHCSTDGVYHQLSRGQVLDLYFALPPGVEELSLQAVGYYIPEPAARTD